MQAAKQGHAEYADAGPNCGLGKELAFGFERRLFTKLGEQKCREQEEGRNEQDLARFGFDGLRAHACPEFK